MLNRYLSSPCKLCSLHVAMHPYDTFSPSEIVRTTWGTVHRIHQWLTHIDLLLPSTADRQQPRAYACTDKCFHQQSSHTRLVVLKCVCEFRESLTSLFPSTQSLPSTLVFLGSVENADMRFPASVFSCSELHYFVQNVLFLAPCSSIIRFLEDGALCGAHMSLNLNGPVDYSLTCFGLTYPGRDRASFHCKVI